MNVYERNNFTQQFPCLSASGFIRDRFDKWTRLPSQLDFLSSEANSSGWYHHSVPLPRGASDQWEFSACNEESMDGVKLDRTQGGHAGLPHISHHSQSMGLSVMTVMGLLYAYSRYENDSICSIITGYIYTRVFSFFIGFSRLLSDISDCSNNSTSVSFLVLWPNKWSIWAWFGHALEQAVNILEALSVF